MSIIIFSNTLRGISGLQKSLIETANMFSQQGHDVHIVNVVGEGTGIVEATPQLDIESHVKIYSLYNYNDNDISHFSLKMKSGYEIDQEFLKGKFTKYALYAYRKIFDDIGKDDRVIFTHPLQAALYQSSGSETAALKVLQIHGNYLDERHNLELLLECQDVIDMLQVVTPAMIDELVDVTRFNHRSIFYIPNIHRPLDIQTNKNSKNVAIIGSLQDRKGQFDAVKAFHHVNHPDATLHIWGGSRGEYYKALKSYTDAAGLHDRVIFCGSGSERDIYSDTGIVIMTSRSEGMSYIHLESASHGIPQICYNFDYGPSDFIEHEKTGYLVPCGDYRALAEKIDDLLGDDQKRLNFGAKALAKYQSFFSASHIYDLYCEKLSIDKNHKSKKEYPLVPSKPLRDIGEVRIKKFHWKKKKFQFNNNKNCYQYVNIHIENLEDGSYEFAFCSENEIFHIYAPVNSGNLSINLKNTTLTKAGFPKKYLSFLLKDGTYHYLYNTTLKGDIEINANFNNTAPSYGDNVFIGDIFHLFSTNGLNLALPSSDIVRNLRSDKGQEIPFSIRPINIKGMRYPSISGVKSEYRKIYIKNNGERDTIIHFPRRSYKEIWEKIDTLERTYGLCDYAVGTVFPWQIIKPVIIDSLMEFHGNWGALFRNSVSPDTNYKGVKKLSQIGGGTRLLFSSARKRGNLSSDIANALIDEGSVVIEHPQVNGYSLECYDITSNAFPITEFLQERDKGKHVFFEKYADDLFERIFQENFDINMNFSLFINGRIEKYVKEYRWWSDFFRSRYFDEVLIPSAFWFPGIVRAAKDAGIVTSDLQYAMISSLHPNYGFSAREEYTTDRIYLWSPYWNIEELPYKERAFLPPYWCDTYFQHSPPSTNSEYDVAIVSQTRLSDSIIDWTKKFSRANKHYKMVYAIHPDENKKYVSDQLRDSGVEVGSERTLDILRKSKAAIGVYSTALYEAAHLGLPVYVLSLPGHEIVGREIECGMFSLLGDAETAKIGVKEQRSYPHFFSC